MSLYTRVRQAGAKEAGMEETQRESSRHPKEVLGLEGGKVMLELEVLGPEGGRWCWRFWSWRCLELEGGRWC